MINLLPPEEKRILIEERNFKEILILSMVVFFAFCSLSLILLFININLEGRVILQKVIWQQKKEEFESSRVKELEQEIIQLNQTLSGINDFYQRKFYLTDILGGFLEALPSQIYLTSISYQENNKKISLNGFSPTRAALLELKENLEKKESFQDIYFPPSNWISPLDIQFSVYFN